MSLTSGFNAPERAGQTTVIPIAATTYLYAGQLVAVNAAGRAVPASDTAGLRVIGRAEKEVDNSADEVGGALSITVKRGVFRYQNSATHAVAQANVGAIAFVEDDATVATQSTYGVQAGRVIEIDAEGVWIDTRNNVVPAAITPASTNGTAAGAVDLAALKTETENIGDDVRSVIAALKAKGIAV